MDAILPGVEGGAEVILPSLRGYEPEIGLDGCIQIVCRKCRHARVIYRKLRGTQHVFPAYCLTCGDVVEIEVRVKK